MMGLTVKIQIETFRFLGAKDPEGSDWDVVIVEEGLSTNGFDYPYEVLEEAIPLYEGVQVCAYEFQGNHLDHLPKAAKEEVTKFGKSVIKNVVGWISDVKAGHIPGSDKKGLMGRLHIAENAKWLRILMKEAWAKGSKNLFGLSHDGSGKFERIKRNGQSIMLAENIKRVDSVDVVSHPAAGGRFQRLVASRNLNLMREIEMDEVELNFREAVLNMVKELDKTILDGVNVESLSKKDTTELLEKVFTEAADLTPAEKNFKAALQGVLKLVKSEQYQEAADILNRLIKGEAFDVNAAVKEAAAKKKTEEELKAKEAAKEAEEEEEKKKKKPYGEYPGIKETVRVAVAEALKTEALKMRESIAYPGHLREKLSKSKLPSPAIERLQSRLSIGQILSDQEIDKEVKSERDYLAQFSESGRVQGVEIEMGQDKKDLMVLALDGFFVGEDLNDARGKKVPRFRTMREAYSEFTDKHFDSSLDYAGSFFYDSAFFIPQEYRRSGQGPYGRVKRQLFEQFRESLKTSDWAEVLGDSITRRMIAEYQLPQYNIWRNLVTDIVPLFTTRVQRRMRIAGYGDLPTISEQGTYQSLTSITDEESYYSPVKKGGLEDLTEEMLMNDDVGAIRRIPKLLGQAAIRTIYKNILSTSLAGNVEQDGSTALGSTARANYSTTALSASQLSAIRLAMRSQTAYGANDTLGAANVPKFLWVPNELEELARQVCFGNVSVETFVPYSTGATTPIPSTRENIHKGVVPVVVDEWTDANNWFATADPKLVPILEVGFVGGKEEPELWVQDQPGIGSVFSADKITYKIRIWFGYCWLDYRAVYANVVSG